MKQNFKKVMAIVLALAIIITTLGAGISAYFTGKDTKNDSYTIGQIEVELVGDNNLYAVEDLTPRYEYEFTRSVKNIGINDAYVFMTVTIPYEVANLHNADGNTILEDANIQLFKYGAAGVAGVASQWKLVDAGKYADLTLVDMAASNINEVSDTMGAIDEVGKTVTYVYAYVGDGDTLKALAPDAETEALFDTMKLANVTDANMENTNGLIKTRAFAIQTLNVLETEYMTGNNADGSEQVNAVWAVINNAAVGDGEVSSTPANIPVTAVDKNGNNLNASATVITGEKEQELLDALDTQGLANKDDVDLLIDVKSDDFDDLADTTIDVSEVAQNGDKVIILHYDETKQEWEFIAADTVENGEVGGDFSSFSPVAIIVIPKEEAKEYYLLNCSIQDETGPYGRNSAILADMAADGINVKLLWDGYEGYVSSPLHNAAFACGWSAPYDVGLAIPSAEGCIEDVVSFNWTDYEIIAQDETTITLKFISDEIDFSGVKLETLPCNHLEEFMGQEYNPEGIAVEGTTITWTYTFEKKASSTDNQITVSVVNADGTPFNSSYTNLTMYDYGFANKTTLTQVAPGSNQYVGSANAGTYRIIELAPTITGGDLIEELVITEGQTEATMILKQTYELADVTLNIIDNSPDAADTTGYEFYIFNANKMTVAKGEQPVVRLLNGGDLYITEANHKVTPDYTPVITDGMTLDITLTADTKVVFNITGAPDDIYDVEYFADGVGSGYADFVDGNWSASGLAAGQYFVTVYGEGGSRYVGSFDYDGSASEVSFEVKQYAAQLNIVNADGQSYRIRFLGEVNPFVDTADSALVNLSESGSFTVNEILLGETNYNFTLEYVSGDGSVDGNRVSVNSGLVIVNITLDKSPSVTFHLVDGADGYYPNAGIGGAFVQANLELTGPIGSYVVAGIEGWGEAYSEVVRLPAGEYTYTLTTYAGYATDPSMKFQSTGSFVITEDAEQTIDIYETFENPVGWQGTNQTEYVAVDGAEVMTVTSYGETLAYLPVGCAVRVTAILDNGYYQIDLSSIEEHLITSELYSDVGYVAISDFESGDSTPEDEF